jgi:peptidoglycan/LPS O-acetylase OafA/YrhL
MLLVVSSVLYRKVPDGVMLGTFLVLTMAAAAAFHRWIELPSIRLGRALANRVERRLKPSANETSPDVILST